MALDIGELTGYVDLDTDTLRGSARVGQNVIGGMVDTILGMLGRLEGPRPPVDIRGSIDQLEGELARARAQLADLAGRPASVEVTAAIDQAQARIRDLETELDRLRNLPDVEVDADTEPAEQAVGGFFDNLRAGIAAAGAGAAIGQVLSAGIEQAISIDAAQAKLVAQMGATGPEAERLGAMAGSLYAGGYGESMEGVGDALSAVMRSGALAADATGASIEGLTGKVMSLSETYDQDLQSTINAATQMVRTGLAPSAEAALDIMARGFQVGVDKAGDLTETMNEYGTQFRKLGLDGADAMGLMSQGLQGGARDADLVADAFKEFSLRAIDGSTSTAEGFAAIGMNADTMAQRFSAGGATAKAALDETLTALQNMKDPVERNTAGVALFGTQWEDLGAAVNSLDVTSAATQLGEVAGAAAQLDATVGETAAQKIERMQRAYDMWTASLIEVQGPFGDLVAMGMTFGPQAISMAGSLAMVAMGFGPLVGAIWSGITAMASWAASTIAQGAVAIGSMIATAAAYVAQWVIMGVQAMARAAVMAAAWLVAMGPVGWVIAIVIGLVALVIAYWDEIVAWTSQAWTAVSDWVLQAWEWIKSAVQVGIDFVVGLVQAMVDWVLAPFRMLFALLTGDTDAFWAAFSDMTFGALDGVVGFVQGAFANVVAFFRDGWNNAVNATTNAIANVLNFVRNLPGNILAALGNLGSLLVNAGRDVIGGLWNGIMAMGAWLRDRLLGFLKAFIPGPVLDFFGIASPSKMFAEIGKWLPEGLAVGILASARVAGDAARAMAAETAEGAQEATDLAMAGVVVDPLGLDATGRPRRGPGPGDLPPGGSSGAMINIYNPMAERATDSLNRDVRSLETLGVI